jgi:GNAT superfamily N-acetyltransferase
MSALPFNSDTVHHGIVIRCAVSDADRERIFRFRYEIYVEEMQRRQTHADHVARTVIEPFDETGHLFLALEGERIVGTARTNFGRETDLGYYRELYGMECVGQAFPGAVSVSTKLMVSPAHRRGTLGYRLVAHLFRFGCERGIEFDFIDCNPHLEEVYEKFGYRRYRGRIQHEEYGDVLPLLLCTRDLAHFTAIRSPLTRICRECFRGAESSSPGTFASSLPDGRLHSRSTLHYASP